MSYDNKTTNSFKYFLTNNVVRALRNRFFKRILPSQCQISPSPDHFSSPQGRKTAAQNPKTRPQSIIKFAQNHKNRLQKTRIHAQSQEICPQKVETGAQKLRYSPQNTRIHSQTPTYNAKTPSMFAHKASKWPPGIGTLCENPSFYPPIWFKKSLAR